MADDSDDDLLTLDVLAECRKGYKESHRYAENGSHGVWRTGDSTKRDILVVPFRIMNEQRAAKAAAEKAKKEAEAKAKKEAAAAEKARTPLHDVSNTKQVNRIFTGCSMVSESSACPITYLMTRKFVVVGFVDRRTRV